MIVYVCDKCLYKYALLEQKTYFEQFDEFKIQVQNGAISREDTIYQELYSKLVNDCRRFRLQKEHVAAVFGVSKIAVNRKKKRLESADMRTLPTGKDNILDDIAFNELKQKMWNGRAVKEFAPRHMFLKFMLIVTNGARSRQGLMPLPKSWNPSKRWLNCVKDACQLRWTSAHRDTKANYDMMGIESSPVEAEPGNVGMDATTVRQRHLSNLTTAQVERQQMGVKEHEAPELHNQNVFERLKNSPLPTQTETSSIHKKVEELKQMEAAIGALEQSKQSSPGDEVCCLCGVAKRFDVKRGWRECLFKECTARWCSTHGTTRALLSHSLTCGVSRDSEDEKKAIQVELINMELSALKAELKLAVGTDERLER